MDWFSLIQTTASIATACGVGVAAAQLYQTRKQARTQFEDSLTRLYLEIEAHLPFEVMLGESLNEKQRQATLYIFYRYFNLCNEQIMWWQQRRVCLETWCNWCDGMQSNFARPAFAAAWENIKQRSGNFKELRRLEEKGFQGDPCKWRYNQEADQGSDSPPATMSRTIQEAVITIADDEQPKSSIQRTGRRSE
jgi:hypothetical protein